MADTAIQIQNVSKRYHVSQLADNRRRRWIPSVDKLKHLFTRSGGQDVPNEYLWALRDVDLTIRKGESWGLIGRNGSGKTTLLRLVARVSKPTSGTVTHEGTLAAMLAASTGFNLELTGRENVYLSAAIAGFRRAVVDAALDQIIEFSGVGALIDTPVKRYSSGMLIRLAFAVAVSLEPDILLVDEILTVGDYEFRLRSLERLKQLRESGDRTILLVSHNLSIVKAFCERAVWLDKGQVRAVGDVDEVIRQYVQAMHGEALPETTPAGLRHEGDGNVLVESLTVIDHEGREGTTVMQGEAARFRIDYRVVHPLSDPIIAVSFVRVQDNVVATRLHSGHDQLEVRQVAGPGAVEVTVPALWLMPGDYRLSVSITGDNSAYDKVEGFPVLRVLPGRIFSNPRLTLDASDMVVFVPSQWSVQNGAAADSQTQTG